MVIFMASHIRISKTKNMDFLLVIKLNCANLGRLTAFCDQNKARILQKVVFNFRLPFSRHPKMAAVRILACKAHWLRGTL